MPRSKGRTGRPYLRARKKCLEKSQICAYCGEAIDLSITDRKDPMYPTVNHKKPVSLIDPAGPDAWLLNNVANLEPMHMGCNSKLGNKVKPELRLSRDWSA
jgi:5-methylcytosine-specific restriction endonuclease McrA